MKDMIVIRVARTVTDLKKSKESQNRKQENKSETNLIRENPRNSEKART